MKELQELIDAYKLEYADAPLYGGGYSKITRKKIAGKNQVRQNFIATLTEILMLTVDPKVEEAIKKILSKYEKATN